jgi:hypothetical protein
MCANSGATAMGPRPHHGILNSIVKINLTLSIEKDYRISGRSAETAGCSAILVADTCLLKSALEENGR